MTIKAGVLFFCPPEREGHLVDGVQVKIGAPWPSSARLPLPIGELPDFVMYEKNKWQPHDGRPDRFMYRARIDMVLVCDSATVSTNHIQLADSIKVIGADKDLLRKYGVFGGR